MALTQKEIEIIVQGLRYKTFNFNFVLGGVPYSIPHELKRIPHRWPVVKNDSNAVIYGTADEENLILTATAPCNVTLEVA